MSKQRSFNTFRMMFPEFVYESYKYVTREDGFHMSFRFCLNDKIVFEPTAFFPARPFLNFDQPKSLLDQLVFNVGMIELISYWKACCPKTVVVKCAPAHFMDDARPEERDRTVAFWKKLYYNGLGEFFYVNSITTTYDDFLNFRVEAAQSQDAPSDLLSAKRPLFSQASDYLVPIGGGKDSVVTLEALKNAGRGVRPLIMNPRGATTLCAERGGFSLEESVVVRRTIHPQLLDLNKKGCLNGHTPFSAMLAFYTLLASTFAGVPNVALSNESSANESTVVGTNVNHQYSKSLEFENDFRNYVADILYRAAPDAKPNYFSFLRPLSELQIAMLFAREPKYFDVFKSCNAGSKTDIWCGNCPKCLFAYIILSPFVEPDRLRTIFGKDLLDDPALKLFFDQLTGHAETKPFECVGTIDEVNSALSMTIDRWYAASPLPCLLKDYRPQPPSTPLQSLSPEHNLTPSELDILKQCIENHN